MIIGRKKEIRVLNDLYDSASAELVALYGRRRVGKTYLMDEVFGGRITFRHSGLSPIENTAANDNKRRSRMKEQLNHFYRSLILHGMPKSKAPESWLDAFYMLEDFLMEKDDGSSRQLVFFDEIQWLDTPRSGFMTGFEAFWNGWACHRHNIMVIVCGSSTSWVLDNLVNNHGGLYDRITYQIQLFPFSLAECEEFFKAAGVVMSRYDIVRAYMAVGGIPYYLKYFDKTLSLPQNLDFLFFSESAPLKGEYDRLFSSLFANPEVMKSIIEALGTKSRGLTRKELLQITGIPDSGTFSAYLNALISGTFIMKYCSFGNNRREEYYKIKDPFCIFWLRFVKGNQGKQALHWNILADTPVVVSWQGLAFENVCFHHIRQIKAALGISGVSTSESLWSRQGKEDLEGTQIDLIISRRDNVVNLCEIKFYSDEFAVDKTYHFTLIRRKALLQTILPKKATIHNTLITSYGLKHNEYFSDFVHTITIEDLFRE